MEQGRGQGPGDLRDQRQQRGEQISHREVNQEHVHPGYLGKQELQTVQHVRANFES